MDFFENAFDAIATAAEKVSVGGFSVFGIVALSLILALGFCFGMSYIDTPAAKLKRASKRISKYLENLGSRVINDDNVGDFTKKCFSEKAPRCLREAWIQYLGVRFGYPSEIVSEESVYDREVKSDRNIAAVVFVSASLFLTAILSFFAMGTDVKTKLGVLACIGLLLSSLLHLLFVFIGRMQFKNSRTAFCEMQDDLDAKVYLQIEKDYSTDASPLLDVAAIVDEIIAKNTLKDVKEGEIQSVAQKPSADEKLRADKISTAFDANAEGVDAVADDEPEDGVTPIEKLVEDVTEHDAKLHKGNEVADKDEKPAILEIDKTDSDKAIEKDVGETANEIALTEAVQTVAEDEVPFETAADENVDKNEPIDASEQDNATIAFDSEDNEQPVAEALPAGKAEAAKRITAHKKEYTSVEVTPTATKSYTIDDQIIEEDKDMFGRKKKENEVAEVENVTPEIQEDVAPVVDETLSETVAPEIKLSEEPTAETAPNMSFDYGAKTEIAPKTEEVAPVEEKTAETETTETLEEVKAPEVDEDADLIEDIDDEDDDDDFTPPRLAKMPQLVNYMLSNNISRGMKIKMAMLLLQAFKAFEKSPEDKAIVLNCIQKLLVAIKTA